MQDLRLIGVQEDGQHLLLATPDGEHYRLPLDDALRAAARADRPRLGQLQIEIDGGMRPREVQAMIRSGASTEEVADRAGWSVEKVRKYEGPILAERAHIADQARQVRVRGRSASGGSGSGGSGSGGSGRSAPGSPTAQTLSSRVAQRMRDRGVDSEAVAWDAWRAPEDSQWTVALMFAAGGRQRQASWAYDPVLRIVGAMDDEARWLSADEPAAGPLAAVPTRATAVYDVEAEGGVTEVGRPPSARAARSASASPSDSGSDSASAAGGSARAHDDEPVDLMTAMRQRTTVGRRSGHRRRSESERRAAPPLPLAELPEVSEPVESQQLTSGSDESGLEEVGDVAGPVSAPGALSMAADTPSEVHEASPIEPMLGMADEELLVEPAGAESPPLEDDATTEHQAVGLHADGAATDDATGLSIEVSEEVPPQLAADDMVAEDEPLASEHPAAAARRGRAKPPPRPSARKSRTPVPSWDDIMFGAKRD